MKTTILLLFFAIHTISNAHAQSNLSNQQTLRLADAGKLWGYIKYFHPYAQTKHINIDSAFAASVPSIIAAKSKIDYTHALQHFLSVLHDPLTTIIQDSTYGGPQTPFYYIKDSILFINVPNYALLYNSSFYQNADTLRKAYQYFDSVNRIVFDIRKNCINGIEEGNQIPVSMVADPSPYLLSGLLYGPAIRTISHKGFVTEGTGNKGYNDYFQQTTFPVFRGKAAKEKQVVVIANEHTDLPPLFQAMQRAGKASIIQQNGAGDITGSFLEYYATDSILVKLRIGESINADGSKGYLQDDVYNAGDNDSMIFAKAKAIQLNKVNHEPPATDTFVIFPTEYFDAQGRYPSVGYRVLAAAKIYTIIDHFYYDKRLMDSDWNKMYEEYLPQFVAAKDSMEFIKAVAAFYAHIQDGHGFISSSHTYNKLMHRGYHSSPVFASIKENELLVTAFVYDSLAKAAGIAIGDIIEKVDGKDAMSTINELRKYQPAGNYAAQGYYIARDFLCREANDSILLTLRDKYSKVKNVWVHVSAKEDTQQSPFIDAWQGHLKHASFRFITKDIGYVDLRIIGEDEVDSMFTAFSKTKALILDMRGYPKTSAAIVIAQRLTNKPVTAAIFRIQVASAPDVHAVNSEDQDRDEVILTNQNLLASKEKIYKGKTVFLMNETTQSKAEHSGIWLKSAANTIFIGTPSAGANGTVPLFSIPGEVDLSFSGKNVCLGNGKPMQRIGLQPNVYVAPTIKGIQQGKDEVLDKAIEYLTHVLH